MITATLIDLPFRKSVTITVTGGPANIRDYVGLYQAGALTYFDWRYIANGLQTRAVKGTTAGLVKFLNLGVGSYEAKFFSLTDSGVAKLLETTPFTVALPVVSTSNSSGFGLGAFGQVPWDETPVDSRVYTRTKNLGLFKPLYATVGWGGLYNQNLDIVDTLNKRLLALEAA